MGEVIIGVSLFIIIVLSPMVFLQYIFIEMGSLYVDVERIAPQIFKVNNKIVIKSEKGCWFSKKSLTESEWVAFYRHLNLLDFTQNRLN